MAASPSGHIEQLASGSFRVVKGGQKVRKDTKTHQDRWVALDDVSVAFTREQLVAVGSALATIGLELAQDACLFSTTQDVAARFGVPRQTVHTWLARYEAGGLEELGDRSYRPRGCPHQMPARVEAVLVELRRAQPGWGPRRLAFELARLGVAPLRRSRRRTGRSARTSPGPRRTT